MKKYIQFMLVVASTFFATGAFAFDCPAAPSAIKDIRAQGYYTDSAHSVVDESKREANEEMTRPFNTYLAQIASMSDRYLAGKDKDRDAASCTITWLATWAQGDAMLGAMVHVNNDQSDYMRQWMLSGIAIVYLKTKDIATTQQRAQIETWLKALAVANLSYWNNPRKSRNNHYYWTGVGIMATAVAAEDPELMRSAAGIYKKGISDIQDDGSLPLEMRRGKRALHYHNYALAPLVMMAELARLNGMDWYFEQDHRIDLLTQRVAHGFQDNSWFAQQAGVAQETGKPGADAGWVEFYRLRANHPDIYENLHNAGPYTEPRMGGSLSLMARVGIRPQQ